MMDLMLDFQTTKSFTSFLRSIQSNKIRIGYPQMSFCPFDKHCIKLATNVNMEYSAPNAIKTYMKLE